MVTEISANTSLILGSFIGLFVIAFFIVWSIEAGFNALLDVNKG